MADYLELVSQELKNLEASKTFTYEVPLQGPQDGVVRVNGKKVIMLASNNYLGLSNHPTIRNAAIRGIKKYGYGVASVRFICGTQDIHFALEKRFQNFSERKTPSSSLPVGLPTKHSSPPLRTRSWASRRTGT